MTLPREPSTLPKRTAMKLVPLPSCAAAPRDEPLADRLRLAEDVLRPHRLVGGDEDEGFAPQLGGELGEHLRAEHVVPHGLERVRLHQRNVLVRGGMEDDRRPVALEEPPYLCGSFTSASAGTVAR